MVLNLHSAQQKPYYVESSEKKAEVTFLEPVNSNHRMKLDCSKNKLQSKKRISVNEALLFIVRVVT